MAYWKGNRFNEKYTYKRVSWDNWTEHERYEYITVGSIENSKESELKVSASFSFEGLELPNVNDLIRIYYSFEDDFGDKEYKALATLFVSYASCNYVDTIDGIKASGTIDGISVLSVLKNKIYGQPYTITKGSNIIFKAQELVSSCGLNVDYTPSVKTLSADHTFAADADYLEMVNWLCEAAGYSEAFPDEYGTVQLRSIEETDMQQYVETIEHVVSDNIVFPCNNVFSGLGTYPHLWQKNDKKKAIGIKFKNDDESIMYPEIEMSNDWQNTPNVVKMLYNTDLACIIAEARNVRGSRSSLESRGGRELSYFEEVSEIGTKGSRLGNLINLAESRLKELSCDIEYVTLDHAYIPIKISDPVNIRYSDMEWTGNVDAISISLSPAIKTTTRIKKIIFDSIEVEKSGRVMRGGSDG